MNNEKLLQLEMIKSNQKFGCSGFKLGISIFLVNFSTLYGLMKNASHMKQFYLW